LATAPEQLSEEHKQLIMHAEFEAEGVAFVAPDGMPGKPPVPPSATMALRIALDSHEEQNRVWAKLSAGRTIRMAQRLGGRLSGCRGLSSGAHERRLT
jgi:uncharacterized glyoxalase superfamily protein PhnB